MFWEQKSLIGLEEAPEVRIAEVIRVSYISQYMEIRYLDDAGNQVVEAEAYYSPAYSEAFIASGLLFAPGHYVCVVVADSQYVVSILQAPAKRIFYEMDMLVSFAELKGALLVAYEWDVETFDEAYKLYYTAQNGESGKFYKFYATDHGPTSFDAGFDGDSNYSTTQNLDRISSPSSSNSYSPRNADIISYDKAFALSVWAPQGTLKLQNRLIAPSIQPANNVFSLSNVNGMDVFPIGRGVQFDTDDPREALYVRGKMIDDPSTEYESPLSDGTGDIYITVGPARRVPYYAYPLDAMYNQVQMRRIQELFNDILYIARPYFPGSILYNNVYRFNAIPPILFSEPSATHITFGFIECKKNGALDYNIYYKTLGTIGVTWRDRETEDPRILDGVYDADYAQTDFSPIYPLEITDVEGSPTIRTINDDRRVRPGYPAGGPEHLVILDDGVNQMTKRPDFLHVQHGDLDSAPSYIDSKINWDFYINDTFMFTMKSRYVGTSAVFDHEGELWYIHHLDLINKLIYAEVHYYEKTEDGVDSFCTIKGVVVDAEGQNVIWEVEKTSVSTGTSYNARPWMQDPGFPAVLAAGDAVPIYRDELYFRFPYNAVSSASTAQYQTVLGYYYPSVDTEDAYSMMMMSGEYYIYPYRYSAPRCAFQVGRNGGWSGWVKDVLSTGYDHYNPYSTRDDPYDDPVGSPASITSYIIKPRSGATVQKWSTFAATATDPVLINMLTPPVARAAE